MKVFVSTFDDRGNPVARLPPESKYQCRNGENAVVRQANTPWYGSHNSSSVSHFLVLHLGADSTCRLVRVRIFFVMMMTMMMVRMMMMMTTMMLNMMMMNKMMLNMMFKMKDKMTQTMKSATNYW